MDEPQLMFTWQLSRPTTGSTIRYVLVDKFLIEIERWPKVDPLIVVMTRRHYLAAREEAVNRTGQCESIGYHLSDGVVMCETLLDFAAISAGLRTDSVHSRRSLEQAVTRTLADGKFLG